MATTEEFKSYILKNRKDFIGLTERQEKELGRLYIQFSEYAKLEADKIVNKEGLTYATKKKLISNLMSRASDLTNNFEGLLDKALIESAELGTEADKAILKKYQQRLSGVGADVKLDRVLQDIPDEAVKMTYSRIWNDGLKLSDRIWLLDRRTKGELERIILEEIAAGRSASSKVLEARLDKLLNPSRRAIRTSLHGRNVSFDAARLLRTEMANAFREANVMAAKRNPGNIGVRWITSTHPCEKCIDYAQADDFGLGAGVYPPDSVPVSRPQCMCTTYEVTISSKQLTDNSLEWMDNKASHPELEDWYENVYTKGGVRTILQPPEKPIREKYYIAKTRQEAENYAKNFSKGDISYRGIDVDIANDINKALYNCKVGDKIPKLEGIYTKAWGKENGFARYEIVNNRLGINISTMKNQKMIDEINKLADESSKYVKENYKKLPINKQLKYLNYYKTERQLVRGSNATELITHEMGHHIDFTLIQKNKELLKIIDSKRYEEFVKLSGYAGYSRSEFIAESFTAYKYGEADKVIPELVEFFKELGV